MKNILAKSVRVTQNGVDANFFLDNFFFERILVIALRDGAKITKRTKRDQIAPNRSDRVNRKQAAQKATNATHC